MQYENIPEQTREDLKHIHDKYWRIEHLYKIKTKPDEHGNCQVVPFKLNFVQRILVKFTKQKKIIKHFTLKARQTGVSTFWLIWWLDEVIFSKNKTIGILAHKWESLEYLMDILTFVFDNMDERFKPIPPANVKPSATDVNIEVNNSRIFISLEIRSTTLHALHVSEWCHCEPKKIRATMGAVSRYTPVTGESTANGVGDDGYLTYQQAKQKKNDYEYSFFPWYFDKDYRIPLDGLNAEDIMRSLNKHEQQICKDAKTYHDITIDAEQILWYRAERSKQKDLMVQEHPSNDMEAFIMSGNKYFHCMKEMQLMKEIDEYLKANKFVDMGDDFIMFHKPIPRHIYVLGGDTADDGTSNNVFKVIDVTDRKEAYKFSARCGLDYFAKKTDEIGQLYNNAYAGIEDNNHGHAVLRLLDQVYKYRNLYQRKETKRLKAESTVKVRLGWHTDGNTRPLMLDQLRLALEGEWEEDVEHFQPEITFYDKQLLSECLTFIEKSGKFEAEVGYFDDDIMASSIAIQMYHILKPKIHPQSNQGVGILIHDETENH